MNEDDRVRNIEELARETGLSVRTIRYYISAGLLPGPGTRGKGTAYGEEHLLRLRLIRMLVEQRVPLAEIRDRLAGLSAGEISALLQEERHGLAERAALAESPREYISALLRQARSGRSSTPARSPVPASPEERFVSPDAAQSTLVPPEPGRATGESWQRWELAPGIELHVRADARRRQGRLIEQLMRAARSLRDDSEM